MKQVPKRATKMEFLSYQERPRELGLFNLEKRSLQSDLIVASPARRWTGTFIGACSE